MIEIKSPNRFNKSPGKFTIFLAGSINQGKSVDWQATIVEVMKDEDVLFYNPRRDFWDSSWKESLDNPKFVEQVNWELDHLNMADLIIFYFEPGSVSPVSLLELGKYIESNVIVLCQEGYFKRGNVQIMCERYKVPMAKTMNGLIRMIKNQIKEYHAL